MLTIVPSSQQLLSQAWRDLHWLVNAPSLIQSLAPSPYPLAHFNQAQYTQLNQWLNSNICFSELATIGSFTRLGLYAERLLQTVLAQCPDVQLLAQHFPLHQAMPHGTKGKRTIGELDYIWRHNPTGVIWHWELAVKLFLYIPLGSTITFTQQHPSILDRFIGTQKQDTLFRKLQHLQEVQLPLAQHPLVHEQLQLHIDHSAGFVKGWLFYPLSPDRHDWSSHHHYAVNIETPFAKCLNPYHLRGWWLDADIFQAKLAHTPTSWRWKILPRLQWLSEHYCEHINTLSNDELWQALGAQWQYYREQHHPAQPLLVVALERNTNDYWQEVHRGFVVPQDWYQA